jgi:hypothetical protein
MPLGRRHRPLPVPNRRLVSRGCRQ